MGTKQGQRIDSYDLVVLEDPINMDLPKESDLRILAPFEMLKDKPIDGKQKMFFAEGASPARFFTINGKPFDPN